MSSSKEIYEALQAVNARLDDTGEQLLVDLVEKIRTEARLGTPGAFLIDATLRRWVEFDAAAKEPEPCGQPWKAEIQGCPRCGLDASAHS